MKLRFGKEWKEDILSFKDVLKYCDVESNVVVWTVNAEKYYRELAILADKRKNTLPVAQRTSHKLRTTYYPDYSYTDYTKGYKGYKIYEFIRDNGPVTAEQVGRFAHEMTYGKTYKDSKGNHVPYSKNVVLGHGMQYLVKGQYGPEVNDKVIKTIYYG